MSGPYLMQRQVDVVVAAVWRWLGEPASMRCLDLGCADGVAEPLLAQHFHQVTAMDIDADVLAEARARHAAANVRFVHLQPALPLPVQPGDFDVAVAFSLLHHLDADARRATLAALARAVRPGGLAAMLEYNPLNAAALGLVLFGPHDRGSRPVLPRQVTRLYRDTGWAPLQRQYLLCFPRPMRALVPLEARIERWPLGAKYLCVARNRAPRSGEAG